MKDTNYKRKNKRLHAERSPSWRQQRREHKDLMEKLKWDGMTIRERMFEWPDFFHHMWHLQYQGRYLMITPTAPWRMDIVHHTDNGARPPTIICHFNIKTQEWEHHTNVRDCNC